MEVSLCGAKHSAKMILKIFWSTNFNKYGRIRDLLRIRKTLVLSSDDKITIELHIRSPIYDLKEIDVKCNVNEQEVNGED